MQQVTLARAAHIHDRLFELDGKSVVNVSRCGPNCWVALADGRRFLADRDRMVSIRTGRP